MLRRILTVIGTVFGFVSKLLNWLTDKSKERKRKRKEYSEELDKRTKRPNPWIILLVLIFFSGCDYKLARRDEFTTIPPISLHKTDYQRLTLTVDGNDISGHWFSERGLSLWTKSEIFRWEMEVAGYRIEDRESED